VVRFYVGTGDFSVLRCVQTLPEANPVVCLRFTRDSDQDLRRPKREDADSPTSYIDVKNAWSCTSILFRFSRRSAKLSAEAG